MKKLILLTTVFIIFLSLNLFAQQHSSNHTPLSLAKSQPWCVADEITNSYIQKTGSEKAHQQFLDAVKAQADQLLQQRSGSRTIKVIPVVVHVVHNPNNPNTPTENVPNSEIFQMIDILNEDFRRLNSDASNTRPAFQGVAADCEIEFCLASSDPNGNPTDGITRTVTSQVYFDSNTQTNDMKSNASGGIDAWDPNSYLNIWVCNISNYQGYGVAGYAYLPTPGMHGSSIDGIVLDFDIGIGPGNRTATHEVGHYLGLNHTWGSNPPSCNNDDGFADTPNCGQKNFGCNFSANSCGTTNGDQIENFMDYSNCPNMFSIEQSNYMNTILAGTRGSLLNSLACEPTVPPTADFSGTPLVVQQGGFVDFTDLSTGKPDTWSWNFAGGTPATSTNQNPSIQYNTIGLYDVSLTASNILGSDTETKTNYVEVVAPTGCDTLNYPPVGSLVYYMTAEGYASGHNEYGVLAHAQYFPTTQYSPNTHVTGGLFYFAAAYKAAGSNAELAFHVYADDGPGGAPGTILGTVTRDLANIVTNVQNNNMTQVLFNPPVDLATVTNGFYFGFEMVNFVPTTSSPSDTLALVTNTHGDASGLNAWMDVAGTWMDYNSGFSNNLNVDLFASPYVTNLPPTADFTSNLTAICEGNDITFDASNSVNANDYYWDVDGDGTFDFYTTNPTLTVTYNISGTFDITLLVVGPCTGLDEMTISNMITVHPNPELTTTTNNTTCGNCDGDATVTATAGAAPYNYAWDTNAGNQTTATATGLCAGTYQVFVSDANGCTAITGETVSDPSGMSISVTSADEYCNNSNGSATANPIDGMAPYDYLWSNSETTATVTGLSAGTYHVTITDANGCTVATDFFSAAVISNANFNITVSVTSTDETCAGPCDGTITTNTSGGTAPYSYEWSHGETTDNLTGLCPGTYDVTVTDVNGCSEIVTGTEILSGSTFTLTTSTIDASCNGSCDGEATASPTGTGPFTYLWDAAAGNQTTQIVNNLCAGIYEVTVSEGGGCASTATVTISEPTPVVASTTVTDASCFGGCDGVLSASATGGTPGYTYDWSAGLGSGATVSGACAGTYTLTTTDANGCTSTATVTVTEPAEMILATSSVDATCGAADGEACVDNVTGGSLPHVYLWSNGSNASCSGPVAAGTHYVTVTDANGCTVIGSETVANTGAPSTTISAYNNLSCNGLCDGDATVSGTGGTAPYTYNWSNGANTATATGLCAGIHSVTLTDNAGCLSVSSVTITEPDLLTATVNKTDVTCNGACDGTVTVAENGGTPPYTYLWSSGGTGSSEANLCPATYTVTVTDDNGCTATATTVIVQPTVFNLTVTSTDGSCFGSCDGTGTANTTGGTIPHSYLWSDGSTTANITNLCAGTFSLTATDGNGCSLTSSITVTEPGPFNVDVTCDSVSIAGLADGSATATNTGGATPFTYLWNNGQTNSMATGLAAGTYSVTVTDANNCTATDACTVYDPACGVGVSITTQSSTCFNTNGSATAQPSGGITPYSYIWSTGAVTQTISGLPFGTYMVTVTDGNGCTASGSANVTNNGGILNPAVNLSDANICQGEPVNISTNTGVYTYQWSSGHTSASFFDSPLVTTTYTVTITEPSSGCSATASSTVNVSPQINASISPTSALVCHQQPVVFTADGGSMYVWNGTDTVNHQGAIAPSSITIIPTSFGTNYYTVEIIHGYCQQVLNFQVTSYGAYAEIIADKDTAYISQGATVNFSSLNSIGNVDIWNFGDGNSSALNNPSHSYVSTGVYDVTLKVDKDGCSSTDTVSITVLEDVVGVPRHSNIETNLQIFPNPTTDQLFLKFTLDKEEDVDIRVMNSIGEVVMVEKRSFVKDNQFSIDMKHLANGAYFLSVRMDSQIITKKVMLIK